MGIFDWLRKKTTIAILIGTALAAQYANAKLEESIKEQQRQTATTKQQSARADKALELVEQYEAGMAAALENSRKANMHLEAGNSAIKAAGKAREYDLHLAIKHLENAHNSLQSALALLQSTDVEKLSRQLQQSEEIYLDVFGNSAALTGSKKEHDTFVDSQNAVIADVSQLMLKSEKELKMLKELDKRK